MRVLVTRAEPSASRTANFLQKHGHEPILMPLFEVADIGNPIPEGEFDGYVFTSVNALKVLRDRQWEPETSNTVAFCVGEKTAAEAKLLGFSEIVSANGDAKALSDLIISENKGKKCELLYLAGVKRSFDMQNALAPAEIDLLTTEVYDVAAVHVSSDRVHEAMRDLSDGFVFFYSYETAKHVCEIIFGLNGQNMKRNVSAVAISPKTADAVLKYPWQAVYVATEPTEHSMVKKLNELSLS